MADRYPMAAAEAAGLVIGVALDAVFADPARWHPVAGFGRAAAELERRMYAPARSTGAWFAVIAVGVPTCAAAALRVASRGSPLARMALTAAVTWTVLGGASLRRVSRSLAADLGRGDLAAARQRLPQLCGRDPAGLDVVDLARATVESVAENTSDAVVAPLCWGAMLGLPGLVGYRAVNTLDAMVGHRTPRYERFGWASARLDDLVNLVPSRLTAVLTVIAAGLDGGDAGAALRGWLRDRHRHPSPNAGQCEAAMAGALGVRLGGRNVYAGRAQDRPILGTGRPVGTADIGRTARLSALVGTGAAGLAAAVALVRPAWRPAGPGWRPDPPAAVGPRAARRVRPGGVPAGRHIGTGSARYSR